MPDGATARAGLETSQPILVTGGAGFIGTNFIFDWLAHEPCPVVNLDKLTYAGNLRNLASLETNPRHRFVRGDIGDADFVRAVLNEFKPWAVINFAAESHVDRSISGPKDFIATNVLGTFQLLECVREFWNSLDSDRREKFRFAHISTDEVYGSLLPQAAPFREGNSYQPNSPYAASKAASDHLVRAWHHTYGLPVLTTNCSNNYGPFQFPEKLIPLVIQNALNRKPLPIYGDGQQIRDWLYVGDHCAAIRAVLRDGAVGETFNIGGDSEKANIQVVHEICDILDVEAPASDGRSYRDQIVFVTDRAGHDRRYAIDAAKIRDSIGWRPRENLTTGLRKTVCWYRDNATWFEPSAVATSG